MRVRGAGWEVSGQGSMALWTGGPSPFLWVLSTPTVG